MKSGIYQISNITNNKSYIGSTKNLNSRKHSHFFHLKTNKHHNPHLQASYNKYGFSAFIFNILEICDLNNLILREQYYVDKLKPEYNIRLKCKSSLGLKWKEDSKKKASEYWKKFWNDENNPTVISRWKPILVYSDQGIFYKEFPSVKKATLELGCSKGSISHVLKGRKISSKGYIFKYKKSNIPNIIEIKPKDYSKRKGNTSNKSIIITLDGQFIGEYESQVEAAKFLGIHPGAINRIIAGKQFKASKRKPRTKVPNYVITYKN